MLNVKYIELLIKNGIDANCVESLGNNALIYSLNDHDIKSIENTKKVIKLLLDNGLDINHVNNQNRSALEFLVIEKKSLENIKILIDFGVNINERYNGDNLLLFLMTENSEVEYIQFLINNGSNVNWIDSKGYSLLELSIIKKVKIEYIKLLIDNKADTDYINDINEHYILFTLIMENVEIEYIKLLIENGSDVNYSFNYKSLLFQLIMNEVDIKYIKLLIGNGANVNDILKILIRENVKIEYIKILIEKGSDINSLDSFGNSILVNCILSNNIDYVKLFVNYYPKLIYNYKMSTKLFICVKHNKPFDFLEYFINNGQDPTFKFEEMEESAFQYCVSNNKINYIDFFMCKVPNKKDYMYDYIKKYATFNIKSRYLTDTI